MKYCLYILALSLFISCQPSSEDELEPCSTVVCLNEGTCVDGVCQCPEGYAGEDCSQHVPPTGMVLHRITVLRFPFCVTAHPQMIYWDAPNGLADCYATFNQGLRPHNNYYYSELLLDRARPPFSYGADLPVTTIPGTYNEDWTIGLWDNDGLSAELMSYTVFKPATFGIVTPKVIYVGNQSVSFKLEVSWTFD